MRILIVGYYFYPQNAPRAFRTHELVKEFSRRGFNVDLILPNKAVFTESNIEIPGLKIHYLGAPAAFNKNPIANKFKKESNLRNFVRWIYRYFNPFTETRAYISQVYNYLKDNTAEYDMIFSISAPVVTHIGTALAIRKNKNLKNTPLKIAEYSDPFSGQEHVKMFFGYRYLDKLIGKTFDYIVVPTEKAIDSYLFMKKREFIKAIPQGFNFKEIVLNKYVENEVPTFAYAGVFYKKIRNPKFLFDFLLQYDKPFKFYLYTSPTNTDSKDIVDAYQELLGDRLVVEYNVPRAELITRLSSMDFLINIDNNSTNQIPSKLIDYELTGRPILSVSEKKPYAKEMEAFLNGDYSSRLRLNIEDYNIEAVVNRIIEINK